MREIPRDPTIYIDRRDTSADTVFLIADTDADIFAFSARQDISRLSEASLAYAAALFLLLVRGVPQGEITVRTPKGIYMIKRLGNDGKYGILLPKCKLLYTKTAVFSDGTDLNAQTVSYEKTLCRVVRCADAQMMSSEVLKRLLLSSDTPCVSAAVAVSSFNGTIDAKAEFLYDKDPSRAIFAASVAALRATSGFSGEEVSLKISDSRFNFAHDGKNLYAFEREPNIFTFHAPDLE